MSQVNKTFNVTLDMKREDTYRPFTVKENDTGNVLVVSLYDDGAAVDLADCLVIAVFSRGGGTASQDSESSDGGISIGTGDNANVATITLKSGSFAPGLNECEIQVYSGTNNATLVTSARFNFECERPIMNPDTIPSTNEYPILVALIGEAQTATDAADAATAAATAAAEAATSAVSRIWTGTLEEYNALGSYEEGGIYLVKEG